MLPQEPKDNQEDFRGFEWYSLHRQCAHQPCILKLPGSGWSLAYAPNGKALAAAGSFDRIQLWDLTQNRVAAELPLATNAKAKVAWSPDGIQLGSIQQDGTIGLWSFSETDRQAQLAWTKQQGPLPGAVAFSPDGLYLANSGTTGHSTTRIWDVVTGQLHRKCPALHFALAPDGKTLVGSASGALPDDNMDTTWTM